MSGGPLLFEGLAELPAAAEPEPLVLLPEAPPFPWPAWYRPTKGRGAEADRHVRAGRHPFGRELGPEDARCGSCVHAFRRVRSSAWHKCAKSRVGSTARTDLNTRWRACSLFEGRPEEPER